MYLQNRKHQNSGRPTTAFNARLRHLPLEHESDLKVAECANINRLDEYIELLYEELKEKIRGSWLILQLSRFPDNLSELANNETLLCALARVLREDGKKSLELSINIVYIFAYFSNFTQFHSSVSQVGDFHFLFVMHLVKKIILSYF